MIIWSRSISKTLS